LCFGVSNVAQGVVFTETFLGAPDDDNSWYIGTDLVNPAHRARFDFDLTSVGNSGRLIRDGLPNINVSPTSDVASYDPALFFDPTGAWIDFTIHDDDFDDERVRLVGLEVADGANQVLFNQIFNLSPIDNPDDFPKLTINLFDVLADPVLVVGDGLLNVRVTSGAIVDPDFDEDFYLDQISFRLEANPVPEPGTMILLGLGFIGLLGFRKKFTG